MRVTVDGQLASAWGLAADDVELEVRTGATVAQVADMLSGEREGSAALAPAWCGARPLQWDHPAGTYPLMHAARLRAAPGEATAPAPGKHLAVVAGPDAGGILDLDESRVWGRAPAADVTVADAWMSGMQVRIGPGARHEVILRDLGSANGWWVWGPEHRRRTRHAGLGDVIECGRTFIEVRPTLESAPAREPARRPWTAMLASTSSALALAAFTGRWYLAILGLVYPAIAVVPWVLMRLRGAQSPPWEALPRLSDPDALSAEGPRPAGSVAIVGRSEAGAAMARAELLARGRRAPEHEDAPREAWHDWLDAPLPDDGAVVLVDEPPSWCERVLEPGDGATWIASRGAPRVQAAALAVSAERAECAARRLAAERHGTSTPARVNWADLATAGDGAWTVPGRESRRMVAAVAAVGGASSVRPWLLDLDKHGPHLLVAGTTGSGKSALLETIVLSLAHAISPADVSFALFDFKGGAGLGRCAQLPHVVGAITDLDGRSARKALAAIGAEIADRKARLHDAGHASFAEWEASGGAPPRLVVVADEFQEIGALHREFVPDLSRLAAQGRSLGMHVILATQRPAGAVTPEIRANVSTTIALRVSSEAESRDLIGTAHAASLPADCPGRAVVAAEGSRIEVQVALPVAEQTPTVSVIGREPASEPRPLADAVATRWSSWPHSDSLWRPPLPTSLSVRDLTELGPDPAVQRGVAGAQAASTALAIGLGDEPHSRTQEPVIWSPSTGPLAIVGPPGSGRSAVLRAVSQLAEIRSLRPVWLPKDPREAARTLALIHGDRNALLIVADAAAALAALGDTDRGAPVDALMARAADGSPLAFSLPSASQHRLASHASVRVVMAGAGDHDDALWSVPRDLHDVESSPGAARVWVRGGWCEARVVMAETGSNALVVASLPKDSPAATSALTANPPGSAGTSWIGVGGDDARPFGIGPGTGVWVVGQEGRERDHAIAVLEAAGARVATAPTAAMMASAVQREVVVAVEPGPRVARELLGARGVGLVDPHPIPGRVLWVDTGGGACVQLAAVSIEAMPAEPAPTEAMPPRARAATQSGA